MRSLGIGTQRHVLLLVNGINVKVYQGGRVVGLLHFWDRRCQLGMVEPFEGGNVCESGDF